MPESRSLPSGAVASDPSARLDRVIWWLAALFPVISAVVQWLAGFQQNLLHDAVFLTLVLLCWATEHTHPGWGHALFLASVAPFLVWLALAPGIGPYTLINAAGYSAALLLPTALAAVYFRVIGVLVFALYGLVVGLISFHATPATMMGVAWHTVTAVTTGLTLAWLLRQNDQVVDRLEQAALRDSLTGLGNRRAFERALTVCWQQAPAHIGIVLMDLDGLKQVNDVRGHACGDALLRQFAHALTRHLECSVFRIGGDEYVVLCPTERLADAARLVRRAVTDTQQLGFPEIDVSVGVAVGDEVPDAQALLGLADQRMYREKQTKHSSPRRTHLEVFSW